MEENYPNYLTSSKSSRPEVFCEKCVLRNFAKFTGKHLCRSLFFNKVARLTPLDNCFSTFYLLHICQNVFHLILWQLEILNGGACNFIKKETLAQVFCCEFCKISKNTFFYRTPLVAASVVHLNNNINFLTLSSSSSHYIAITINQQKTISLALRHIKTLRSLLLI